MFFSISKSSFLLHILRLYLRCCSPLICITFFIISLGKWIPFLNLSICSVSDSSMQLTKAVTALLSPIMWKADTKLIKQQLLGVFWWYFSTGDSGWNTTFFLHYQLVLQIIDLFSYHYPLLLFDNFFYKNTVHVYRNFLLTTHDQYQTIVRVMGNIHKKIIMMHMGIQYLPQDNHPWCLVFPHKFTPHMNYISWTIWEILHC